MRLLLALGILLNVCGCTSRPEFNGADDLLISGVPKDVAVIAWKRAEKIVFDRYGYRYRGTSVRVYVREEVPSWLPERTIADQTYRGSSLVSVYQPNHPQLRDVLAHEFAHAILNSNDVYGHPEELDGLLYLWEEMRRIRGK